MIFENLEKAVVQWGIDRGLLPHSMPLAQAIKLAEELDELVDALAINDKKLIADGLGDMMVVMTMIASSYNLALTQCYEIAYEEIKSRKGKLIDGIFVKD